MSLSRVLGRARAGIEGIRGAASRRALVILAYHGLQSDDSPIDNWMLLRQSRFAQQVEELRKRYDVLPLDEAVARLRSGTLDRASACITFDDGYENNLTLALPVLRAHNAPATIFLATNFIGSANALWTTELDAAFDRARTGRVDLSQYGIGAWSFDSADEARRAGIDIKTRLKDVDVARRDEAIGVLRTQLPDPEPSYLDAFRFLDWNQVREIERTGLVTIGAHTVHHEILARLSTDAMEREIKDSISRINAECSQPSHGFAYPNGRVNDFDSRATEILKSAGCKFAVSTVPGFNSIASDRFALRRLSIAGQGDLAAFQRLISRVRNAAVAVARLAPVYGG